MYLKMPVLNVLTIKSKLLSKDAMCSYVASATCIWCLAPHFYLRYNCTFCSIFYLHWNKVIRCQHFLGRTPQWLQLSPYLFIPRAKIFLMKCDAGLFHSCWLFFPCPAESFIGQQNEKQKWLNVELMLHEKISQGKL